MFSKEYTSVFVPTAGCDSCKAVTESPGTGRDIATTDGDGCESLILIKGVDGCTSI